LLYADPVRLTQVFLNLLSNATHYTDPGGRIVVNARKADDHLEVAIQDNGIGLSPDARERIFEAFVQIETPQGKAKGGLGIGLTLARNLVELHGGHIRVASEGPGKGSQFTVVLPLTAAPPLDREVPVTPAPVVATVRRLMVVDDNEDAAHTLGTLLRLQGHEVRVLISGEAALAEGPAFAPHIVLLDIGMPGLNGLETARAIRA